MKFYSVKSLAISLLAAFALLAFAEAASAEVILIANQDVPESQLDQATVKNIYLGKKTFWDRDTKITVAVLKDGDVHESFLKKYVGKTPEQFANYWNKILFTGEGTPPTPFASEEDMVEYVKKTKGAIGYIDSGTAHEGVKVISVK